MKKLISERKLDCLGRISIPIEARRNLGMNVNDEIECYVNEEGYIVLQKTNDVKEEKAITRKMDELGRFTLPIEIRKHLKYKIFLEDKQVLLKGIDITHADTIRSMSNEELAKYMYAEQKVAEWKNSDEILAWLNKKIKTN